MELIDAEKAGIDFRNTIKESGKYNHVIWDYVYNGGGVAIAGWPLGAIFTGIFCNYAITQFGWKYAFFIAGCISWALPSE